MKILHITKKYPHALGGDATVVSNLEKQQWAHGDKVAILTSNCKEIIRKSNVHLFGLRDTPAALDAITPRRLVSLAHLFFKSFSVIRNERPDVIHTHSIDMAFAASFAARFYKVPMVHTFHIVTFHDKQQSWLRRKTELWFKKGANPKTVTAPDEADVDQLKQAGVANAALLPNGIDLKFWHKHGEVKNEIFTFIAAGRFEEQKGFKNLIQAVGRLKKRTTTPFKVVIAGDGSQMDELQTLAVQLNVEDSISFAGRKSVEELRALYNKSDAAVIPSLWESTPLTLLEAWAMHLPVVSTPVGILQGKTHADDAAIVPIQDEKALAKAMLMLMEDADTRRTLADRGIAAVQQYTWPAVHAVADRLYKAVVSTPPAAAPAPASPSRPGRFNARQLMLILTAAATLSLATAPLLPGIVNALITLPLAILVPGLLWRFAAFRDMGGKTVAATIALAAALGILLVTIESLLINWLLPLVGIDAPLQAKYLVPAHLVLTFLLLAAYLRTYGALARTITVKLHVSWLQTVRFVVPLLLPLAAAAGAFRQNNGLGNELTIIALCAMAGLSLWFVLKPKAFNPIWLLFTIALGLLLTTSMRSWYVSGFDISQEFQVFTLTLQHHYWDMSAIPGNAYNACLSLTTLPAALQQMVGVAPELIFKFFYQIAFALTAVVIYLLGRRFADTRGAFLVGLFFVAQAQFIGTMPAIARQELGLLFFALMFFLLIEASVKISRARMALLGLLGAGMVVSHYSTAYVTIFFLLATGAVLWILKVPFIRRRLPTFRPVLSAATVTLLAVVLMAMSWLWYSAINSTSSNLTKTISSSWATITSLNYANGYTLDKDGSKTRMLLGGERASSKAEDVASYKDKLDITQDITYAPADTLPAQNTASVWFSDRVRDILALVVKILLPISPLLLLLFKRTRSEVADVSFLGLGALATFIAFIFLPALSQSYNLERVLQQALILLSLTGLWALWFILPARKMLNTILTTAFVLVYFVFSPGTGLINQAIGGTAPRMNMNSIGEEYDKYYVHQSEVRSAAWLADNCADKRVWADRYATLRVTAYAGVPYDAINSEILKGANGCLMLDRTNVRDNVFYGTYNGRPVRYTVPAGTFDGYDLLYDNGDSRIYQY